MTCNATPPLRHLIHRRRRPGKLPGCLRAVGAFWGGDMTEQNAPERILANISHLTLVEIDQAEMMRLADEIEYVRADLYDAAWNDALDAALVLVRENSMSSLAAEKAIRALRRETEGG